MGSGFTVEHMLKLTVSGELPRMTPSAPAPGFTSKTAVGPGSPFAPLLVAVGVTTAAGDVVGSPECPQSLPRQRRAATATVGADQPRLTKYMILLRMLRQKSSSGRPQ